MPQQKQDVVQQQQLFQQQQQQLYEQQQKELVVLQQQQQQFAQQQMQQYLQQQAKQQGFRDQNCELNPQVLILLYPILIKWYRNPCFDLSYSALCS
jgi:pre-mRNA-processing factor 39